jgi:hypothetical protein
MFPVEFCHHVCLFMGVLLVIIGRSGMALPPFIKPVDNGRLLFAGDTLSLNCFRQSDRLAHLRSAFYNLTSADRYNEAADLPQDFILSNPKGAVSPIVIKLFPTRHNRRNRVTADSADSAPGSY